MITNEEHFRCDRLRFKYLKNVTVAIVVVVAVVVRHQRNPRARFNLATVMSLALNTRKEAYPCLPASCGVLGQRTIQLSFGKVGALWPLFAFSKLFYQNNAAFGRLFSQK